MMSLLCVLLTLAASQTGPALPPGIAEYVGRVQSGMMAIGGETTGIRLVNDKERFELAAEGEMRERLRALDGQQVTVRGRLTVRQGVEVGTRRIITVTEIRLPAPVMRRKSGVLAYQALYRPGEAASITAIAALPPAAQAELKRRTELVRGYRPSLTVAADHRGVDADMDRTRQELELALVTFAGRAQAGPEAAAYAQDAKLYYEWEGDPSGPMDELQAVADYIGDHRTSPFRGYLELFALHRARAAFEAAGSGATVKDPSRQAALQREAAAMYQSIWARLQQSADVLVKALADDIDGRPFVYIDIAAHPLK